MRPFVVLFASMSMVAAQGPLGVPFADLRFQWGSLPLKADNSTGGARGDQVGYNRCNATTGGPTSLCQTAVINSLDDFCLWAPPNPGRTVGDIEGEMIAWCTQPGHGTRVMPDGTITGVQFTRAPEYIQVVGFMDQTKINMVAGDSGGEMDPHGADARGNPIGGLVFSNSFNGIYSQVIEWHNFNGGNQFCLKACNPNSTQGRVYCNNRFDTQGCGFNAPSNAQVGRFESCASDNQPPPGVGPPIPPSSSECTSYSSTAIYGAGATVTAPIPGGSTIRYSSTPGRPTPSQSASGAVANGSGSKTASGSSPSNTSSAAKKINVGFAGITSIFAGIMLLA